MLRLQRAGAALRTSARPQQPSAHSPTRVSSLPKLPTGSAGVLAAAGLSETAERTPNFLPPLTPNNRGGSVQFSSVAQSCPTLCDPINCSTPGLPVHHQLPESTQTHVHRVGDAIQTSHPLSSLSPPALIFTSIRVFSNESALRIR